MNYVSSFSVIKEFIYPSPQYTVPFSLSRPDCLSLLKWDWLKKFSRSSASLLKLMSIVCQLSAIFVVSPQFQSSTTVFQTVAQQVASMEFQPASVLPHLGIFLDGLLQSSLLSRGRTSYLQHHSSASLWLSFMVCFPSIHALLEKACFWLDGPLLTVFICFLICCLVVITFPSEQSILLHGAAVKPFASGFELKIKFQQCFIAPSLVVCYGQITTSCSMFEFKTHFFTFHQWEFLVSFVVVNIRVEVVDSGNSIPGCHHRCNHGK